MRREQPTAKGKDHDPLGREPPLNHCDPLYFRVTSHRPRNTSIPGFQYHPEAAVKPGTKPPGRKKRALVPNVGDYRRALGTGAVRCSYRSNEAR